MNHKFAFDTEMYIFKQHNFELPAKEGAKQKQTAEKHGN